MIFHKIEDFIALANRHKPILAVDYGTQKIGCAISDNAWTLAIPLVNLKRNKGTQQELAFVQLLREYEFASILLGWPMNLMGDNTNQSGLVMQFAKKLVTTLNMPIMLYDERFTSKIANNMLKNQGFNRKERNEQDDKIAAGILLEDFLRVSAGQA